MVAFISNVYGKFTSQLVKKVQDTFAASSTVAETSFAVSKTVCAFEGVK